MPAPEHRSAPRHRSTLRSLWLGLLIVAVGCGDTREVRTQPPRPAIPLPAPTAVPDRTALTVTLAIDESLPSDVAALRLRVGALWLKPGGEPWLKRSVGSGVVESGGPAVRLLTAQVPHRRYDSLAVVLTDPFVTFSPNAGGPLTIADSGVVRLPLGLDLGGRSTARLSLHLAPERSFTRSGEGMWRFRPHLSVRENAPRP